MTKQAVNQHIKKWLDGDDRSYRMIFDYYYPKLFPISLKSVRQREENEELVMNVFISIWQNREQVRKAADFESYIFAIFRNQMVDHQRKKVLATEDIEQVPLTLLGTADHPELNFKELQQLYQKALGNLPPKQREVFLMSREQGLTQKEIAERQRISVNTVNNHIKAANQSIRDDLGSYAGALQIIIAVTAMGIN